MIKKMFKVNEIEELLYGDSDSLNNISDSIIDSDHWYIQHEIIFQEKESEKYWMTGIKKNLYRQVKKRKQE